MGTAEPPPARDRYAALQGRALPLLLAALTCCVASRFATLLPDLHHDGIMLKPALDVAGGGMLFRDTFAQYGALTVLLQAAALRIFGPYLAVIRLETALFYAASGYVLYLVWVRLLPGWLAFACGLVWLALSPYFMALPGLGHFLPWSSVYALFFSGLSLHWLLFTLEGRPRGWAAASGAAAALAFWCRQPVGALLGCAFLLFFAFCAVITAGRRRETLAGALAFCAGGAAVCAVFLAWLAAGGALKDMYIQNIRWPALWAGTISAYFAQKLPLYAVFFPLPWVSQFTTVPSLAWAALPAVSLAVLGVSALAAAKSAGRDARSLAVLAVAAACLASWGQYYPWACENHTYWGATPMIGLAAWAFLAAARELRCPWPPAAALVLLLVLFLPDIRFRTGQASAKLGRDYIRLERPEILRGMKSTPAEADRFDAIAGDIDLYFSAHPYGGLANLSADAIYPAFRKGLTNFHPLYLKWPEFQGIYPDFGEKYRAYRKARRPIIFSANQPEICDGYAIKTLVGRTFITAPENQDAEWALTGWEPVLDARTVPPGQEDGYLLTLQFMKAHPARLVSIEAEASVWNRKAASWRPAGTGTDPITMTARPAPGWPGVPVPESGRLKLRLEGFAIVRDCTSAKFRVTTTDEAGRRQRAEMRYFTPCTRPG